MSVLKTHYDKHVNLNSPVIPDYQRVVNYDEDGNEIITTEPVDYAAIIASRGDASLWKLGTMLKAGIDPGSFSIHTSAPSRIENESGVQQMLNDVVEFYANQADENKPAEEK